MFCKCRSRSKVKVMTFLWPLIYFALSQLLLQIIAWSFRCWLCLAIFFEAISRSKVKVMFQFLTFDINCYILAATGDSGMGFSVLVLIKCRLRSKVKVMIFLWPLLYFALSQLLLQIIAWSFRYLLCLAIFFETISRSKVKVMFQFLTFDINCYILAATGDSGMGFSVLVLIKCRLRSKVKVMIFFWPLLYFALSQLLLQIIAWSFRYLLCLAIFFETMSRSKVKVMFQFLTFDINCYSLPLLVTVA